MMMGNNTETENQRHKFSMAKKIDENSEIFVFSLSHTHTHTHALILYSDDDNGIINVNHSSIVIS